MQCGRHKVLNTKKNKMATLKDVEYSKNGEKNTKEMVEQNIEIPPSVLNYSTDNSNSDFITFVLKNHTGKGKYYLDGKSNSINPKTGKKETIWHIPGEDSIWQSELVERLKDKEVRSARKSFEFFRKRVEVRKTDTLSIEFLKNHAGNLDNPKRLQGEVRVEFEEYNPAKIQEEALKKDLFELDMADKARYAPDDKMRKHALYLGIRMADDLGFPKTIDGIRSEYIVAAKRNPNLFKDSFESPFIEVSYLIKKALSENKITTGSNAANIVWAGTNGFITQKIGNKSTHDCLLDLAMGNTPEGQAFKSQLSSLTS